MEKDIGKIKKNDAADIMIKIDDFGGKPGLTIREYITSEKYTGFTKAGTRIPAREFNNFKELINSIDPEDLKNEDAKGKENSDKEKNIDENPDY